jgi:hypothetical protein
VKTCHHSREVRKHRTVGMLKTADKSRIRGRAEVGVPGFLSIMWGLVQDRPLQHINGFFDRV